MKKTETNSPSGERAKSRISSLEFDNVTQPEPQSTDGMSVEPKPRSLDTGPEVVNYIAGCKGELTRLNKKLQTIAKTKSDVMHPRQESRLIPTEGEWRFSTGEQMTPWAVRSLMDYCSAPVGILLWAEQKGYQKDAAELINAVLDKELLSEKKFIVRKRKVGEDDVIRHIASELYAPFDNHQFIELMDEIVGGAGVEIKSGFSDNDDIQIDVVLPDLKKDVPLDSSYFGGFRARNSEVGRSSIKFDAYLWRKVCENGLCVPIHGFSTILRHASNDHKLFAERVADQISLTVGAIEEVAWKTLSSLDLAKGAAFSKSSRDQIVTHLAKKNALTQESSQLWRDGWRQEGDELNAFSLIQGLTRGAQESTLHRAMLEELAGRMVQDSSGDVDRYWSQVDYNSSSASEKLVEQYLYAN
jgi:hypothetical protein